MKIPPNHGRDFHCVVRPREESDLDLGIRSPSFYPLNYGGNMYTLSELERSIKDTHFREKLVVQTINGFRAFVYLAQCLADCLLLLERGPRGE